MRTSAFIAIALGLAVAIGLMVANNAAHIALAVAHAGPWLLLVIALHLPQTIASAFGWRPLIVGEGAARAATPLRLVRLRFIREAVNALLPVANVGGDVVRARLLAQSGAPVDAAAASCTADLAVEMATQAVFTLVGVTALLAGPRNARVEAMALGALAVAAAISAGFLAAQRYGLIGRLASALAKAGARTRWTGLDGLERLGPALERVYSDPRRLGLSAASHLASWLLGVLETGAALWVLGLHPSWREALVVESLGQVVRALGFAVPGALGVQEGGYVLICSLFGVAPAEALALSLVRRVRELALGAPGLLLWQWTELRRVALARRLSPVQEAL